MAVCRQNLPLGGVSSRSSPSLLVGALFKKSSVFFWTQVYLVRTVPELCQSTVRLQFDTRSAPPTPHLHNATRQWTLSGSASKCNTTPTNNMIHRTTVLITKHLVYSSDEQLVHVLSSADVARRLMLIAKRGKWQFVVKTCR
jgi:hypothetical protein